MARAMNGEGSFRKISKEGEPEKWTGRKQFGYKSNGKPNIKAVYGSSENECRKKMKEFEKEYQIAHGIVDQKTIFINYLNTWFETFKKPTIKRRTYNTLQDVIKCRIEPYDIANYQLHELNDVILQNYIIKLGTDYREEDGKMKPPYSRESIKKTYNLINGCLRYAEHKGHIKYNPMFHVGIPKEENLVTKTKKAVFFELEDMQKIYQASTRKFSNGKYVYSNNGLIISFLMFTGLRIGEALGLNWGDYDKEAGTLSITKELTIERDDNNTYHRPLGTTKSEAGVRIIPVSDIVYELLEALYSTSKSTDKDSPILTSKTGNRANPRNLRRTLNSIQETMHTKTPTCGLHTLRHTFVSYLLNETETPIKVVSELAGHSSPDITLKIYAHTLKKQKVLATDQFNLAIQHMNRAS